MTTTITAGPIDASALAPYASVVAAREGKATVIPEVMEMGDTPGAHAFTVLCPLPVTGPVQIAALERHPHSTQSFVPLHSGRWLILVAPTSADGSPDISRALAFVAGPEDAICIGRNVWHAGLTVFDSPAEFGMIMWKTTAGDDGILHTLDQPVTVVV